MSELYSPEKDSQAREAGLVYIEDLALSSAIIALKISCAPLGLGFLNHKSIEAQDLDELHSDLVTGISKVSAQPEKQGLLSRLLHGEAADNNHYRSERDFDLQVARIGGQLEVSAGNSGYWDGRPFQIRRFTAGENLDPVQLTGFVPFNPRLFDDYQAPGVAQNVIDDLRTSGYPLSIEVARNEAGRTFERARDLEKRIGRRTDPELARALNESLRPIQDLYDR
jgi:hypothetical protein